MPLLDLNLPVDGTALPGDVRAFLHEADQRIEQFRLDCHVPGFVPSDFVTVYGALRALAAGDLRPGRLFCEWGSGFGVVACLAAMLEFDAFGIEIEGELVDAARQLADDFGLPVEFICGSFIPKGSETCLRTSDRFAWLTIHGEDRWEELGLSPADFDVVFAYPWPDEEGVIGTLFERYARAGAVLVTHHESGNMRLRRKTEDRAGRRRKATPGSSEARLRTIRGETSHKDGPRDVHRNRPAPESYE
jgi:hypothetical protein